MITTTQPHWMKAIGPLRDYCGVALREPAICMSPAVI